ncbi:hypothetical protein ES703_71587 [subsurface metagenome]
MVEHLFLDPAEISPHLWRLHIQSAGIPKIIQSRKPGKRMNLQAGKYKFFFHLFPGLRVKIGHLDHVILFEDFLADPELLRIESEGRDSTAFAVSPVVHLDQGLHDVPARDFFIARQSDNPAASFHRLFASAVARRR